MQKGLEMLAGAFNVIIVNWKLLFNRLCVNEALDVIIMYACFKQGMWLAWGWAGAVTGAAAATAQRHAKRKALHSVQSSRYTEILLPACFC